MHRWTAIRNAIASRLATLPSSPAIYRNRAVPISESESPAILLSTPADALDPETIEMFTHIHQAELDVRMSVFVLGGDDPVAAAEQLALEIAQAWFVDETFGGLVQWSQYVSMGELEISDAAHAPKGAHMPLLYRCWYDVDGADPQ